MWPHCAGCIQNAALTLGFRERFRAGCEHNRVVLVMDVVSIGGVPLVMEVLSIHVATNECVGDESLQMRFKEVRTRQSGTHDTPSSHEVWTHCECIQIHAAQCSRIEPNC